MQSLNELLSTPATRNSNTLHWTEQATMVFENIKQALTLLFHSKQDAPTSIMTDASLRVIGAVLQQYIDGQWCPIAYFSKKLNPAEIKYNTFDREVLTVYCI